MIKKLFKKALIAGAVTFMSFASINAMATQEWHKVSDQMEFRVDTVGPVQHYFASSWEEMCIVYAEKYFIRSVTCIEDGWNCLKYKGPAKAGYQNRSAICMGTAPMGDQKYETLTYCTEGLQHPTQGVFGCFEYLECDPAKYSDPSEMPKNCSKPVLDRCDPKNNANGIVPEDCPKTEPKIKEVVNDPMCEKITRTQNGAGAVVCDNKENFHPCIWTDHLNIQPKAAEDVIRFCFNTHEKRHIETRNRFKINCGPTDDTDPDFGIFPNTLRGKVPSYYLTEADAYTKTVDCLADNIAYCKNDPICVKRIRDEVLVMRNKVFKSLRDYNEYCSKPENNCEQVILQIKSNLKNEKE